MKNYVKKLISSLMAISLVAPVFSGIPVFAENSDGTIVDQTQALTVVGKRIKGDDTYFEISLEVNEDHDNFSSVGVVLRYDPDYIIPAESWDEGAGAADMSENTTWATRRALPTLGLETWSTHTALAYQEDTPAPGAAGGKKYGYLYLGAEHPLAVEEPEATADPSATAAPTADPSAPTAEPEATPAPGTRPVVVARFMYKTTAGDATATPPIAEVTGAAVKAKLTEDWTTGTNSSGSAEPINWDYDWTSNKILTIADDDVAGKSPAQYPFAIYTQDYVEKAYMHTWPTVTPTATTAPGDPTPTPMPVSAYAPVIGTGVDAANHLTKDDIMIITCEGESAKATGGIKLSDIMVILFYDWDDSLIGTLTAAIGAEMQDAVNNYVREKLVHPQLQGNTNYASLDRKDTYRGVYPYSGPSGSDPRFPDGTDAVTDGEKYPVTNKLDYVLAGKTFHADAPYAGGWTKVTADNMSECYTGLSSYDIPMNSFGQIDEFGVALDSSGNPDPSLAVPIYPSYDFNDIKETDLDGGVLMVKAVYTPGTWLNNGNGTYTMDSDIQYSALTSLSLTNVVYGISLIYRRINSTGYGVNRAKEPKIRMEFKQKNATGPTTMAVDIDNSEVIDVLLSPSNQVDNITNYQVVDTKDIARNKLNIMAGTDVSLKSTQTLSAGGTNGFETTIKFQSFQEAVYAYGTGATTAFAYTYQDMNDFGFKFQNTGANGKDFSTAANLNQSKTFLKKFIAAGQTAGQTDPHTYTYYQIQYAIITKGTGTNGLSGKVYVTPSEAESFCKATYPWCT